MHVNGRRPEPQSGELDCCEGAALEGVGWGMGNLGWVARQMEVAAWAMVRLGTKYGCGKTTGKGGCETEDERWYMSRVFVREC